MCTSKKVGITVIATSLRNTIWGWCLNICTHFRKFVFIHVIVIKNTFWQHVFPVRYRHQHDRFMLSWSSMLASITPTPLQVSKTRSLPSHKDVISSTSRYINSLCIHSIPSDLPTLLAEWSVFFILVAHMVDTFRKTSGVLWCYHPKRNVVACKAHTSCNGRPQFRRTLYKMKRISPKYIIQPSALDVSSDLVLSRHGAANIWHNQENSALFGNHASALWRQRIVGGVYIHEDRQVVFHTFIILVTPFLSVLTTWSWPACIYYDIHNTMR